MNINDLIFLIPALAGCLGCAVSLVLVKKISSQCQYYESKLKILEQNLEVKNAGAVGMGHRILALEKNLKRVCDSQEQLVNDGDDYAYTQARQMLKQGADTETVAFNCGFSSSEAKLMALVQNQVKNQSKEQDVSV